MKPIVIAVAVTGSVPRKGDNPAVPTAPAEQIESTHAAFEAGASLVHIHVRNPELVGLAAEAAVRHGRRPAIPAEARAALGLAA